MAMIGYARVSTTDQNVEDQVKRLREAGCTRVYSDIGVSGKKASRPEWDKCLEYLREGDVLVTVKLDRAGRSLQHLVELADDLALRGIGFKVLDQPIDTSTSSGRLLYNIIASVAEFERDLISERTMEGLRTAHAHGRFGGRQPKLSDEQRAAVIRLHDAGTAITEIAAQFDVSRPAIYRVINSKD